MVSSAALFGSLTRGLFRNTGLPAASRLAFTNQQDSKVVQLRLIDQSRAFSTSRIDMEKLKIALIGQSQFAAEVYKKVKENGHEVVGVFTIPDKNNREDPVATAASADGVKVFKAPTT